MGDMFCTRCGHRNPGDANFCSSCGAAMEVVRGEDHTHTMTHEAVDPDTVNGPESGEVYAVDDLPEGVGMLVVHRGPGAGSRFVLDQDVVAAGRHPESHIFLDDVTVSRRHAEVVRTGSGYLLRDVGSLNGTYLNRERIDEAPLRNGDELQVGRFKLVFLSGQR
jgi:pSer/pThr/pTyr-binding forkhead associated (FHA) protein